MKILSRLQNLNPFYRAKVLQAENQYLNALLDDYHRDLNTATREIGQLRGIVACHGGNVGATRCLIRSREDVPSMVAFLEKLVNGEITRREG